MKLYIRTVMGHQYHIHESGDIQRLDMYPSNTPFIPSGQWKMIGIRHIKKSILVELRTLLTNIPEILNGSSIRYKNGKSQYTLIDLDHGSIRMWGDRIAEVRHI